ncbi:hypothetical protein CAY91_35035, partial [Pseudomonas aeruginosa]
MLLLFIIGLELSPRRLWVMRKSVFGVGLLQVLLTGVVIGTVAGAGWHHPSTRSEFIAPRVCVPAAHWLNTGLSGGSRRMSPDRLLDYLGAAALGLTSASEETFHPRPFGQLRAFFEEADGSDA